MIFGLIYLIGSILTAIYFNIVDVGLAPENSDLKRMGIAIVMGVLFPLFWFAVTIAGAMAFYIASKNGGKLP